MHLFLYFNNGDTQIPFALNLGIQTNHRHMQISWCHAASNMKYLPLYLKNVFKLIKSSVYHFKHGMHRLAWGTNYILIIKQSI